ncbi:uncharacterized protein [Aphelocoma coerulescens]|uniref:uncharacterized protein n=1 Tax=Aphelocoma coerulescens TaxID=39617 RepID=UPI0036048003
MVPPHPPPPPGCLVHRAGVRGEGGCWRGAGAGGDATTSPLRSRSRDRRWAVGLPRREEDSGARLGLGNFLPCDPKPGSSPRRPQADAGVSAEPPTRRCAAAAAASAMGERCDYQRLSSAEEEEEMHGPLPHSFSDSTGQRALRLGSRHPTPPPRQDIAPGMPCRRDGSLLAGLLAQLGVEVAGSLPVPMGLSQRGKLRHGTSPGMVGKAGFPIPFWKSVLPL